MDVPRRANARAIVTNADPRERADIGYLDHKRIVLPPLERVLAIFVYQEVRSTVHVFAVKMNPDVSISTSSLPVSSDRCDGVPN